MDKKVAAEIERAIFTRLDRLVKTAGKVPLTAEFVIEAAKTEITVVLAPYKIWLLKQAQLQGRRRPRVAGFFFL